MISRYTLTSALKQIGNAEVFIGDPFTLNGMNSIGAVEGRIRFAAPQGVNVLTAPELTGDVAHDADVTTGAPTIVVPIISDGKLDEVLAKISPTGVAGGGSSSPDAPLFTSVLLIPRRQIGGGLTYNVAQTRWERTAFKNIPAAQGADAAPTAAVWLWRAMATFGELPYVYEGGGKQIIEATFTGFYYDGAVNIPEGHKVWTAGDPRRVGVAIPVIL